jgi:hypothetical protein
VQVKQACQTITKYRFGRRSAHGLQASLLLCVQQHMVSTVYAQRFERVSFNSLIVSSPATLEPAQTLENGILPELPPEPQTPTTTTKRIISSFSMHIALMKLMTWTLQVRKSERLTIRITFKKGS